MPNQKTPHPLIKKVTRDEEGNPVYHVSQIEHILTIEKARKRAQLEKNYAILPKPKTSSNKKEETGK